MRTLTIQVLRMLLVMLAAGIVLLQLLILPLMASQYAEIFPEVAYLAGPFTAIFELVLLGAEVIVACIWMLLSMVARDRIFSSRAFRFVDVIVGTLFAMAAMLLGVQIYLSAILGADPPAVAIALIGGAIGCATLATLMLVMRGLLKKAAEMDEFMSEVA